MTSPVVIRILKELLDRDRAMPMSYKNALLSELLADEAMTRKTAVSDECPKGLLCVHDIKCLRGKGP